MASSAIILRNRILIVTSPSKRLATDLAGANADGPFQIQYEDPVHRVSTGRKKGPARAGPTVENRCSVDQ
jgi:hypothetical protein